MQMLEGESADSIMSMPWYILSCSLHRGICGGES
jgi:hypothetical protein